MKSSFVERSLDRCVLVQGTLRSILKTRKSAWSFSSFIYALTARWNMLIPPFQNKNHPVLLHSQAFTEELLMKHHYDARMATLGRLLISSADLEGNNHVAKAAETTTRHKTTTNAFFFLRRIDRMYFGGFIVHACGTIVGISSPKDRLWYLS